MEGCLEPHLRALPDPEPEPVADAPVAPGVATNALGARVPLVGWGRQHVVDAYVRRSVDLEAVTAGALLSRGLGRAYGDAALPPPGAVRPVVHTVLADRILAFDERTGVIRVEAGLRLKDLNQLYLPRCWFTPVTPGTQYVTIGGMVASDVHGKNHHVHGTFSRFVRSLRLRVGDGRIVECSRDHEPELFWATCGGMGLTGHILEVEFELEKIPSPWIYEESERFDDLAATFDALNRDSAEWPMTVSWIDTSARGSAMGRGMVIRGRWARADEAPPTPPTPRRAPTVPDVFPSFTMNPTSIRALNAVWYAKHGSRARKHVVSPEGFFYQLDMATEWNRGYGRRGFTQFQCVLPSSVELYRELLDRFQRLGGSSFITVFKDCGEQGAGLLSFPQRGTSLALDVPVTADTPRLIHELNALVIANGGRIYLAKDSYTWGGELRCMYPRIDEFQRVRRRFDPEGRLVSALSVRLLGDAPN